MKSLYGTQTSVLAACHSTWPVIAEVNKSYLPGTKKKHKATLHYNVLVHKRSPSHQYTMHY